MEVSGFVIFGDYLFFKQQIQNTTPYFSFKATFCSWNTS